MRNWRHHVLTILWIVVIAILTLLPARKVPEMPLWEIPYFDKIVHSGIFGLLSFLMLRGIVNQYKGNQSPKRFFYITFIISLLYGGLIEYLQMFVPGRSGDAYDLIANTVGILIGMVAFYTLTARKK